MLYRINKPMVTLSHHFLNLTINVMFYTDLVTMIYITIGVIGPKKQSLILPDQILLENVII